MHALDDDRAARSQITSELNQCVRRLRQYRTEDDWISAVLDAASRFVQQTALLTLHNGMLMVRACRNLNLPEQLSFVAASAGAFASAIETKDPVIALRTPSEVSEAFSVSDREARAHIIPIGNEGRVVALLFAAGEGYLDVNALELIAGIASSILERRSNSSLHAQIAVSGSSRKELVRSDQLKLGAGYPG